MSGKLRMNNFDVGIGEIVYVMISAHDKSRCRLVVEGCRGGLKGFKWEKEILDRGEDPLKKNNSG